MKEVDSRLVGIMGTVIFHLVVAIIFMSFKLQSVIPKNNDQFAIEFVPEEIIDIENKEVELPLSSVEEIFAGDDNMLNIARNLANQSDVEIDPNEYIDMVKEELIKNGMLNENNFIDAQRRLNELDQEFSIPDEETSESPTESQIMEANYQGPTRIYYDLEGRNHTYLPIPIYKCQGSGRIAVNIDVNQRGLVTNARIDNNESTTNDPCLLETAINTALISRFNPDLGSPRSQSGTITYHFVAQ